MTQLTTRERRQQKTKQAILQAARELINEYGAEGLSLRAIARRIDYSPAGLYEYFDSKHQIIEAVCGEGIERLRAYLKSVPTNLSPAERLLEMGLAYLKFARREPEHFMLIFTTVPSERISFDDPFPPDSPYKILLEAVQAAIDAGEFNLPEGIELKQVAYSLWSLVHGMAMLQQTQFRHGQVDFETINRWALEVFARGLKQSDDIHSKRNFSSRHSYK